MKENIKVINEIHANLRRASGVYAIKCIPLKKLYIGSTDTPFRARFSNHNKFLRQGTLGNRDLQEDYNLLGSDAFSITILQVLPPLESVIREQSLIDMLKPEYNKQKARNNSKTNTGKKFSQEWKDKIREKAKLYRHEGEVKKYITNTNKEGATKFKITKIETGEIQYIESRIELRELLGRTDVEKFYNEEYKGYTVEVIKTQRKSVTLLKEGKEEKFNSFEKCDKFLNKWRGYTSTKNLRSITEFEGYKAIFS